MWKLSHASRAVAVVALLAPVILSGSWDGAAAHDDAEVTDISIVASPITSFARVGGLDTSRGKLQFRGGIVLTCADEAFGGWSGLLLDSSAKSILAISDTGLWLRGTLTYASGRLAGVENARMGPLLGQDGSVLKRNRYRDAEGIALKGGTIDDGVVLVSFERKARIVSYRTTANGLTRPDGALALPPALRALHRNQGFESVAVVQAGRLKDAVVAFAERLYNPSRDHSGWIWTARGVERAFLKNVGDFDVTDIASDSDGSLYVLERRFRWTEGVRMRIRRLAPDELQPGQTAVGETLLEADMSSEIDNMEGIAVTKTAAGETLLTVISDDNLNRVLQRTIVLQFALPAGQTTKARLQE